MQRKQATNNLKTRRTHDNKRQKLGISKITCTLDIDKIIFNYSSKVLTQEQKQVLSLGLDFCLPVYRLKFYKYFLACEKLWKAFDRVPIYNCVDNAKSYFKSQLQAIAHKFYFNFKPHENRCSVFSKKQFSILKEVSHDKSIYIRKPDKGNGIVFLNKQDYIAKVNRILSDRTKFQVIENVEEQKLIIKLEDKLNHILRNYKKDGRITADFYNSCFASGTNLGVFYGLPKVHKINCPIRPILSACSMHNFNLGKALVPLISYLLSTQHTLKNSAEIVNFISSINNADSVYTCSLDVESLYTNIPVHECIEIALEELFNRSTMYHGFSRVDFKKQLVLAVSDTYFKFDNAIYEQVDGLSMGSAMSPVLANIFLNRFVSDYLLNCPQQYTLTLTT